MLTAAAPKRAIDALRTAHVVPSAAPRRAIYRHLILYHVAYARRRVFALLLRAEVGASKVSITQPTFQSDPNIYEPALFSYPVLLLNGVDIPEVEVLAE